ncbi:sensor histidine kinase [Agrilutibacter solisilvae]|uniref:histidine kinase n=1 Tax=Agrilutibacter solisilvae TaxID=2763317 RepID=A0A975ASP2_9GAMM|nr:ATP-binding protein [Lysobacter solisilvae]QSX79159.1 hypothetical protein I8J32_004495 [Lysobacter solisilvae]
MTETDSPPPSRQQLAAMERQLQLLTDAVVHDLRAPLRSIDAFVARVATSAQARLEPDECAQLQRVREAASRMTDLLAALSDWSHAGRAPLKAGPVDLSLLAEWAIADLREAHPGRAVESTVQPGMTVLGDERLLRRLLDHLLSNAWQFAQPDAPVRVEVAGQYTPGHLHLRVRDHGMGFDPRYAHKLFEPLQRLHGPQDGARHGLGLATALTIAQRHGGGITAVSRPGDGAEFTVDLPQADSPGASDA